MHIYMDDTNTTGNNPFVASWLFKNLGNEFDIDTLDCCITF